MKPAFRNRFLGGVGMTCNSCGRTIGDNDRVCRHCGSLLPVNREERQSISSVAIIIIVAILILFVLLIGILYQKVLGGLGDHEAVLTDEEASETADSQTDNADEEDAASADQPSGTDQPSEVSLVLSADALRLKPGAQIGLSVAVQAPYGQDVYVYWSSTDETVATIDPTGMVTAVAEGECSLIASAGEVSASCTVQVSPDVGDLTYDHLLPSDTRILTDEDLDGMSQEEVMLARNEIFARHGRVFVTESIQAYFDEKAWYIPDEDYDENTEGALTEIERTNLQFIIEYEQERGWR